MKESDIKVIETMIGAFQKSMLNPLLQVQGIVVIDTTELRVFKCFYGRGSQRGRPELIASIEQGADVCKNTIKKKCW